MKTGLMSSMRLFMVLTAVYNKFDELTINSMSLEYSDCCRSSI